jgi:hypothetical protein
MNNSSAARPKWRRRDKGCEVAALPQIEVHSYRPSVLKRYVAGIDGGEEGVGLLGRSARILAS